MKAYDFMRTIGWSIIDFLYGLIDSLFDILKEVNAYNLIDTISDNKIFKNFHSDIIVIALTLLGLFAIWKFVTKILEPEDGLNTGSIIKEIIKCTSLVLLSVLLFSQVSLFSIKLSGFTANMFKNEKTTLGNAMEVIYVDYDKGYPDSFDFAEEDFKKEIQNGNFTEKKEYNEKYITSDSAVNPNTKKYKYNINWILSIVAGAFFLYALFFSGMMLARRQIEFIFLFLISPIVFATSIGNKRRRGAVFEQLVSLTLQAAVVMLIIGITVLIMQTINATTFFSNSVIKDMILKTIMYIGCATFLLTGSQAVNRFIGANVSANSGREQMMSMMSFNHMLGRGLSRGTSAGIGGALLGGGVASGLLGKLGGNKVMNKVGKAIQNFGSKVSGDGSSRVRGGVGSFIGKFGSKVGDSSFSNIGKKMRSKGKQSMGNSFRRNYYRRF